MRIDIVTIFPEMFAPVLGASILGRAQEQGRISIQAHQLREYTHDKRRTVDDRPYGGGAGMVMRPEPIFEAVEAIERLRHGSSGRRPSRAPRAAGSAKGVSEGVQPEGPSDGSCQIVLLAAQGETLTQPIAKQLAACEHLVVICGRYEGVDERVRLGLVDREMSIGDYVLTGGELPAMVLVDCLARLVPGVLGHDEATVEESFEAGLLEYPQYTRPIEFRGMQVPEVLRSGHHEDVAAWRKRQAVARTAAQRPDLFQQQQKRST